MSSGYKLYAVGSTQGRRHALIDEAKAEHDVAFEEMRRAQDKVMNLALDYEARIRSLPRSIHGAEAGAGLGSV